MLDEQIEKRILFYNDQLLNEGAKDINIGLFHGKMGLCIYFYLQYRFFQDKRYEKMANNLLLDVYQKIEKRKDNSLENGILGIGFGILFLLENNFCEGNPNSILKEVDDSIFKSLCNSGNTQDSSIIHEDICKSIYLCTRLKNIKLSKNERMLFSEVLTQTFNRICCNMPYILNSEPLSFSPVTYPLLSFLHLVEMMEEQQIYAYKIRRTLREWCERVRSVCPVSIGHQYLLDKLTTRISENKLIEKSICHNSLAASIRIDDFFKSEMRDMELSFYFGASGLWLHMQMLGLQDRYVDNLLLEKLRSSCIWTKRDKEESEIVTDSLFAGIPGIILTYQSLLHNYA